MMAKDAPIFISEVWYGYNGRWAFQRAGNIYNLYDYNGDYVKWFRSFKEMTEYIEGKEKNA